MTRFGTPTVAAAVWLAAAATLVAVPTQVSAQDCNARDIQCMVDYGTSTYCLHEYLKCLTGQILAY